MSEIKRTSFISEPIRILHVIGRMNRGGAETMIMNLYRNIDRTKVQFDFVEHYGERAMFDDEIEALGGHIYRCPRYTIKNHLEYKKWWNDFFKEHFDKYDAVHGHIGSTAAIYLSIAKKYGLYTIAHSHSAGKIISVKDMLYNVLSYNTRNVADYFFGCSELAGVKRYGKCVVSNKEVFSVLNNAIDTDKYIYDEVIRTNVRKELHIENDEFVIGHVGRFDEAKNQQHLVRTFAEFQKFNDNSRLVLVGTGEIIEKVKALAAALGVAEKVIFTGVRSDVNELLQAFDVFAFPSVYEGLPVTVVEAQAAGLPCLISDAITDEVSITNLVTYKSINDSFVSWANEIEKFVGFKRNNTQDQIVDGGYDINSTSKWLTDFYLSITKRNKL